MVRDYLSAKKQVRHFTPDLGSRRVRYDNAAANMKQQPVDKIVLQGDEADHRTQLEFERQPKFRSAMNTPYQSREREQLRTIAAEMRQVKA